MDIFRFSSLLPVLGSHRSLWNIFGLLALNSLDYDRNGVAAEMDTMGYLVQRQGGSYIMTLYWELF